MPAAGIWVSMPTSEIAVLSGTLNDQHKYCSFPCSIFVLAEAIWMPTEGFARGVGPGAPPPPVPLVLSASQAVTRRGSTRSRLEVRIVFSGIETTDDSRLTASRRQWPTWRLARSCASRARPRDAQAA